MNCKLLWHFMITRICVHYVVSTENSRIFHMFVSVRFTSFKIFKIFFFAPSKVTEEVVALSNIIVTSSVTCCKFTIKS
jgi:hypothetical protein